MGDLYTDPQMHTVDQKDYGEANLGVRGMALFFSSHVCSPLCQTLGVVIGMLLVICWGLCAIVDVVAKGASFSVICHFLGSCIFLSRNLMSVCC